MGIILWLTPGGGETARPEPTVRIALMRYYARRCGWVASRLPRKRKVFLNWLACSATLLMELEVLLGIRMVVMSFFRN